MEFTQKAKRDIAEINRLGGGALPVCISKTQYSLSDNPALFGRPTGFKITVGDVYLRSGAGFVVAMTGNILDMPERQFWLQFLADD